MTRGLINSGNKCYMNCILQLLAHLPGFLKDLDDWVIRENPDDKHPILSALSSFLKTYQGPGAGPILPHPTLHLFPPGDQHDAHEYLIGLIDCLYEETKNTAAGSINARLFNHEMSYLFINQTDPSDSKTLLMKENILVLPLCGSMEEAFRNIETTETIPDWESETHKACFPATKTSRITRWPRHLFLLVHRYHGDKNQSMSFPLQFLRYSFVGCVIHMGTPLGGHYLSMVAKEGRFYHCDDANVGGVPHDRIQPYLDNAYLLLYSEEPHQ